MTSLPCKKCEYLESTGTQWIDTGYTPNDNTKVEIKFSLTDLTGNQAIFGSRKGAYNDSNTIWCRLTQGSKHYMRFDYVNITSGTSASDGYVWSNMNIDTDTVYTITKDCHNNYINGILHGTDNTKYSVSCPSTACLFTVKQLNTPLTTTGAKVKLYYAKIWEKQSDGKYDLKRDFIPALDHNNIPGMFDKVHNTMYYNIGTGVFGYKKAEPVHINFKSRCEWEYGHNVLQEFMPKINYFDGATVGEIYEVNKKLKTHLEAMNDFSFTLNFKSQHSSDHTSNAGGYFIIGDSISGNKYIIHNENYNFKVYDRDKTVLKFSYVQQPNISPKLLHCHNKQDEWWDKNMTITFTFTGNNVRMFANGKSCIFPDNHKDTIEYARQNIIIGKYIQLAHNTVYDGRYETDISTGFYKGNIYSLTFFNHALTKTEINLQLLQDQKKFGIIFSE